MRSPKQKVARCESGGGRPEGAPPTEAEHDAAALWPLQRLALSGCDVTAPTTWHVAVRLEGEGPGAEPLLLQYNDPFTPPWARRNEVAVALQPTQK